MNTRRFALRTIALAGTACPLSLLAARPLAIVASFSILADMVREVAGDAAVVTSLVGPEADAHVFAPTPADARKLAAADLVFVNGLGFEGWVDRLVRASGFKGPVVIASRGVAVRRAGREVDPHAWQDLAQARRFVANIEAALVAARPEAAAAIAARAERYRARIDALDAEVRAMLAPIPRGKRRVVTSHDAFGYFGAAYGIDFLAPQGMSTESEASARDVARLIGQIRKAEVRAVFVESITNPRLVERLAREGGATVGGTLHSDALSAPGGAGDTYLKMFAHNANAIATALRGAGSSPTKGTP